MIEAYRLQGSGVRRQSAAPGQIPDDAVWLDLKNPTREEEKAVEALCGFGVPTREEMGEIEFSSRLYSEDGADFMTASLVFGYEDGRAEFAPATFILGGDRLITLRYDEPPSFRIFGIRLCRKTADVAGEPLPGEADELPLEPARAKGPSADAILVGLLETVIDQLADLLEAIAADLDGIGGTIFRASRAKRPTAAKDFKELLRRIGAAGDLASRTRESLATLDRLIPFLQMVLDQRKGTRHLKPRVKAMARDVQSLNDFVSFLSNKTTFLLDTTVGMISIEQNAIIKIFSVAAVGFMPPTLIASIYGMNFEVMPELGWRFGYPMALALMVLSAVLPLLFFRYKRWL